jgi:hypothetical protein
MRAFAAAAVALPALAGAARPAAGHAFGQRYDLPLPLDFYLAAAAAAVLLSFVIAALALRPAVRPDRWQLRLPAWLERATALVLGACGVLLFLLVLAAGLFGADEPTGNIAPVLVWVLWWVGLLLASAFIGNLWPALDPWSTLYRLARRALGRPPATAAAPGSAWPAVLLFFAFAWLELVSSLGESPRSLALLVLAYSLGAWSAMALCGEAAWRTRADPFRRVFGLFGRFAPLGRDGAGSLVLRPPGAGLLGDHPQGLGAIAFVILVLATVTFDGLSETPLWAAALVWLSESQTLRGLLLWLSGQGVDLLAAAKSCGLLLTALVFFLAFALVCRLSALAGGEGIGGRRAMSAFALSFLPIAIAYHTAHYLSYLLLAGQLAIPLASDPLGLGWDLLGTRDRRLDLGAIGAKTVWYVAVAAIVTGHVIAVVLAHAEALRLFPTRRRALQSQLPMLLLMLAFTMTSLWILSQPIVQEPK